MRINFGKMYQADAIVVEWALQTVAGAPIAAAQIPEPGTAVTTGLGLLALGARGVRRRRRQSARGREAA